MTDRSEVDLVTGLLRLEKATGRITFLRVPSEDSGRRHGDRAARKVSQHWKAGELPDESCWAS